MRIEACTVEMLDDWVALRLAVKKLLKAGIITTDPIMDHVAAVSCGI